jgi:rRNA maturation protein Nop10
MALLICLKCTTAYTVGAPACPHCGGKKAVEQGSKGDPTLTVPDMAVPAEPAKEV